MSNVRVIGRFRIALVATVLLLVALLAVGSLFAANDRESPDIQPVAESVELNGVDPGLGAKPPIVERVEPPAVVVEPEPGGGVDPGDGQEIEGSGGTGALAQWLADRPDEMGSISIQDAMKADEIDVEWLLYQAVYKDAMTEEEAEDFRAWFSERPTVEEAPELIQHQPGTIYRPGDGENNDGTSGGFKAY